MARKAKNANKKNTRASAQNSTPRKSRRTRAPAPLGQTRKSSHFLTLAIMGGAVFFALRGCSDSDERFYTSVQECTDDGNASQVCHDGWDTAKRELTAGVTNNLSDVECQLRYGSNACYYNPDISGYVPAMAGFTLAKAKEKTCDPQYENCGTHTSSSYIYRSSGHSWSSRPVWRDRNGDYVYRSGETADRTVSSQPLYKTKTVSRGGWGSSSKSFRSRGS
ncbi:DUF1190 domain-containing protein [Enterobacteriaceae bacterium 4M9]|nr:DUF1190 domain-containing protein [Enterobacteriaceae bacterium 4M9]